MMKPKMKSITEHGKYSNHLLFLLLVLTIVLIFVFNLYNPTTTFSTSFFKLNRLSEKFSKSSWLLSSILPPQSALNELETMKLADSESNVAAEFWYIWKNNHNNWSSSPNNSKYSNVTYCGSVQLTSPYRVKHHNVHWQKFERPPEKGTHERIVMFLYNAYYDNRIVGRPVVRLISINNKQTAISKKNWSCLLWFSNLHYPVLSNITDLYIIWPEYWGVEDGIYGTQIISCAIPRPHLGDIPRAVSLQAQSSCDKVERNPSNVLRVIHNNSPKPKDPNRVYPSIGVCVKSLRYGTLDYSVRLVEWLEMIRILGGEKVYFYVLGAVDNIMKVLDHYKEVDGLVEWRHTTLVDSQPNLGSLAERYAAKELGYGFWQEELLEYNDCLYRNLFVHDYVAVLDVDELIVPQRVHTWQELIKQLNTSTKNFHNNIAYISSQQTRIFAVLPEQVLCSMKGPPRAIPAHLYTMRHTHRSPVRSKRDNIKCLHRTSMVSAVHNHYPMHCLNTTGHHTCRGVTASPNDSLMMHYRLYELPICGNSSTPTREELMNSTNCTVHDRNMWRYFERLDAQVSDRLMRIFS